MPCSSRWAWFALGEVMGVPAWKSHPCWFMVADGDQAIPPDAECQFAARMGATTVEIPTNHVAMVSHPVTWCSSSRPLPRPSRLRIKRWGEMKLPGVATATRLGDRDCPASADMADRFGRAPSPGSAMCVCAGQARPGDGRAVRGPPWRCGIGAPASALRRAARCPRPAGNPAEPPQPRAAGRARLCPRTAQAGPASALGTGHRPNRFTADLGAPP